MLCFYWGFIVYTFVVYSLKQVARNEKVLESCTRLRNQRPMIKIKDELKRIAINYYP